MYGCENVSKGPGRGYQGGGAVVLVFESRAFSMGPPSTVTREMREVEEFFRATKRYGLYCGSVGGRSTSLGQEVISAQAPNRPCEGMRALRAVFVLTGKVEFVDLCWE